MNFYFKLYYNRMQYKLFEIESRFQEEILLEVFNMKIVQNDKMLKRILYIIGICMAIIWMVIIYYLFFDNKGEKGKEKEDVHIEKPIENEQENEKGNLKEDKEITKQEQKLTIEPMKPTKPTLEQKPTLKSASEPEQATEPMQGQGVEDVGR